MATSASILSIPLASVAEITLEGSHNDQKTLPTRHQERSKLEEAGDDEWGILTPYTALFVPEPVDGGVAVMNRPQTFTRQLSTVGRGGSPGGGGFGGVAGSADAFGAQDANNSVLGAAPTVALRSGEAAVNVSQTARAQKNNAQVGNYFAYKEQEGFDKKRSEDLARRVQNVNQRTFVQNGKQWTDATYDAKKQKQIVKVKLYSPAYFALTRRNANFAKWAALGNDVVITANATQAVQFAADGKESLTDAEVKALAGK